MPSLGTAMMLTLAAKRSPDPECDICGDTGWNARGWRIKRCYCLASVDTHPQGGDVERAPLVSGAVGAAETPNTQAKGPLNG